MKTKGLVYGIILIVWLITCIILYKYNLIDFIGIIVSFVFAIPTIIYDLISTYLNKHRDNVLKALSNFCKLKKYINDVQIDCIKTNHLRIRGGLQNKMGLTDANDIILKQIDNSKNFYLNNIKILFGKKNTTNKFKLLQSNTSEFFEFLKEKIIEVNPTDEEIKIYNLIIDDNIKKNVMDKK